jgi:hypothetical protein
VTATTNELTTTATADELAAPRRGLVAALQHSLPRNELFAGLYILACANGLVGRSILTFNLEGWTGAVLGFELNVIVLFACFAGVYLIACSNREKIRTSDLVVALGFLGLVILPIYALKLGGGERAQSLHSLFRKRRCRAKAGCPDLARAIGAHAMEPSSLSILRETLARTRRNDGGVVAGYRADRKFGSLRR